MLLSPKIGRAVPKAATQTQIIQRTLTGEDMRKVCSKAICENLSKLQTGKTKFVVDRGSFELSLKAAHSQMKKDPPIDP